MQSLSVLETTVDLFHFNKDIVKRLDRCTKRSMSRKYIFWKTFEKFNSV